VLFFIELVNNEEEGFTSRGAYGSYKTRPLNVAVLVSVNEWFEL
jgi:hypothetical protein